MINNKSLLILALPIIMSGCTVDWLNLGCRDIARSGYSLCQDDENPGLYYLEPRGEEISAGGVLDGTVQSIGWSGDFIIARRYSTFRGDPDGLMVLDVRTGRLSGPVDPAEVALTYPSIKQKSAASAWSTLH